MLRPAIKEKLVHEKLSHENSTIASKNKHEIQIFPPKIGCVLVKRMHLWFYHIIRTIDVEKCSIMKIWLGTYIQNIYLKILYGILSLKVKDKMKFIDDE